MNAGATLSPCGRYRYKLWRYGLYDSLVPRTMLFIMLNPSTADAMVDDPTIRRCRSFAMRDGYSQLEVVNLFALRATDPRELARAPDPIGPDNDAIIAKAVLRARDSGGCVVAAWGAHAIARRRAAVVEAIRQNGAALMCLGLTKDGSPRHPLYVRSDEPLGAWL